MRRQQGQVDLVVVLLALILLILIFGSPVVWRR